eukprot:SAG31_NODE_3104_length_4669_cov_3.047702_3_plen_100_part_00
MCVSLIQQTMSVAHFLRRYRNEELYAVSPLPITMAAQLLLPKLLMLGASSGNDGGWLTSALALSNIWLSAGGTTSALHADDCALVAFTRHIASISAMQN